MSDPSSSSIPSGKNTPSRILSTLRRPFSHSAKNAKDRDEMEVSICRRRQQRLLTDDSSVKLAQLPSSSSRSRSREVSRPTVEQIAMGLHLSRTPHLPAHLSHLPYYHQQQQPYECSHTPISSPSLSRDSPRPSSSRRHSHSYFRTRTDPHTPSRSSSYLPRFPSPSLSPSPSRHTRPRTAPTTPHPPPPTRSALKKSPPSTKSGSLTTLDTALSASTATSSTAPPTPTSLASRFRLSRFLPSRVGGGAGSRSEASSRESVVEVEPAKKAVRFQEGVPDVSVGELTPRVF
ncbi:hypothetical protein EW146_g2538 [Bondarzewia mesenterica]|uniref:Uncharacterized protein n=1 Tax=Bondarzewia mesenterica TaxID=1095465 RepID=A0A4S4M273_9AGAM|nr:hypothetical protein EW146_g2538 [Bondarzewia mesenterica]